MNGHLGGSAINSLAQLLAKKTSPLRSDILSSIIFFYFVRLFFVFLLDQIKDHRRRNNLHSTTYDDIEVGKKFCARSWLVEEVEI